MRIEWNRDKAATNLRKHRVSFDEASTVFHDQFAFIFTDEDHSLEETREIIIGHSSRNRLLLVCFTERAQDVIRVFSARLATRKEGEDYEEHTGR